MMKYIFVFGFIFILIICFIFIFYAKKNEKSDKVTQIEQKQENISESSIIQPVTEKPENTSGYKSIWIKVLDPEKILLYSNLSSKKASKTLATENSCVHLISGGFYDKEGNHIGLFISEGEIINRSQNNRLFNGYFSISKTEIPTITEFPVFSPRLSLQTGPFLIKNSVKQSLTLENDENARRIATGIDKFNKIYFFAIYDKTNSFSGPKLSELPDIIENININSKLNLTDVINLDGGTHSSFISDLDSLIEAAPIGSFFCIKP